MKKIFFIYFLPFIISLLFLYVLVRVDFGTSEKTVDFLEYENYIAYFDSNPAYENRFLAFDSSLNGIQFVGSSELGAYHSEASPDSFFSANFPISVYSVGSAGNQSFSIYSQLLANTDRLQDANVVVFISPIWFTKDYANGVRSPIYLRYNSEAFLTRIAKNDSIESQFKTYAYNRIREVFWNNILHKNIAVNYIVNEVENERFSLQNKSKNVEERIRRLVSLPVKYMDEQLFLHQLENVRMDSIVGIDQYTDLTDLNKTINWDSLFTSSKLEVSSKVSNNKWGINDEYYNTYIHGNSGRLELLSRGDTKELDDFKMLVDLCKAKNVNASFLILPMNPYYYTNLDALTPYLSEVENCIADAEFPCLNMWESDTAKYQKEILSDIMHLSKYGWYKADKFISNTYKLEE